MLFGLSVLLSAALVFLIQPLLAKQLLPYFGGGAAVWTACMLFFQTLLLGGYAYAYLLSRHLSPLQQRNLHSVLLIAALAVSAGNITLPDASAGAVPLAAILLYLLKIAGLPYLLLSATGPLVQHWFAHLNSQSSPYRLYALSNIGSVAGLLCYPFLLEPLLQLNSQWQLWLGGLSVFVGCMLLLLWRAVPKLAATVRAQPLQLKQHAALRWLALSACGVILLLAVTQQLTQNITPVPFLWVIPLLLYLLSFILVFASPRFYQRSIWLYVFCLNLLIALALFYLGRQFDVASQLLFYLLILFSGCMLCHGELARSKPEPAALTAFYFWLALGGAVGSLLMNLLLPLLFVRQYEFLLVLLSIYLLVLLPLVAAKPIQRLAVWSVAAVLTLAVVALEYHSEQQTVFSGRNFYGSVQVRDVMLEGENQRQLIDGTTSHGSQFTRAPLSDKAQSYYRDGSGAALAIEYFLPASLERSAAQLQQRHIGLIGLGAGALAAYGRAGNSFSFYEINPLVIEAAQQHFSYLADSDAEIILHSGDGRLLLADQLKDGSQQFDVLVLDAFSSDSIPQHLLTAEAMQLYWQHLQTDGVLAVHVSNNYLDLTALLRNHATALQKQAYFFALPAQGFQPATEWVLITANSRFANQPVIRQAVKSWPTADNPKLMWTDSYSNLLQLLK